MTSIGTFTATREGFEGRLHSLTIDRELTIVPCQPGESASAPDFRVMAGTGDRTYEVGAGWKRMGDKAGTYIALLIDDPALARPLRANLIQADRQSHVLLWTRRSRRQPKD